MEDLWAASAEIPNMVIPAHQVVAPYSQIARTYDLLSGIPDFFRTRRAFEALVRHYSIRFCSAVDVGCGTGLFACYLGECWGVPVFAVDRSPQMLCVARSRCPSPRVSYLLQDFRYLRLPCRVDLATANTYTLNHLMSGREVKQVFRRIHENLRSGGHFLFDLVTHRQPWKRSRAYTRRLRVAGQEVLHQIRWDPGRRLLTIVISHRVPGPSPAKVELYVGRGYSPLQIGRWLQEAGFTVRGIHDGATLRLASGCPPRVIVIAQKTPQETLRG